MLPPNPCAASSSTIKPYFIARFSISFSSAGNPKRSTGMTAFGVSFPSFSTRSMASSNALVSILKVHKLISTKMGVAPANDAQLADAIYVKSGTNTASPMPTLCTFKDITSASVPFPQVIQCFLPT